MLRNVKTIEKIDSGNTPAIMFFMKATCIVCDAEVLLPEDVQESEVVTCKECKSRLVVVSLVKKSATLSKAPDVEEDWGE